MIDDELEEDSGYYQSHRHAANTRASDRLLKKLHTHHKTPPVVATADPVEASWQAREALAAQVAEIARKKEARRAETARERREIAAVKRAVSKTAAAGRQRWVDNEEAGVGA